MKEKDGFQLLEEDIKKLFHHHRRARFDIWEIAWSLMKGGFSFVILFLFFFLVINFPAYKLKFSYYFTHKEQSNVNPESKNSLKVLDPVDGGPSSDTALQALADARLADLIKKNVENNHLVIPKIHVNAPVVWSIPTDSVLEKLSDGVVHYTETSLPGENGNVFIAGHSSNYWWDKGKYNQVFALLDTIDVGDRIYVNYNLEPYVYKVESTKVVSPSQIEVLNPTDHSVITLMTCTPVGTTISCRIVQARQIYPQAKVSTQKKPSNMLTLPAIR